MKKRKSHSIPLFFLALLLLPLMGVVLLQAVQGYLKSSAPKRMQTEKLWTIALPENKIKWVKKDKELLLEGKLFDIKTLQRQNGIATVIGFFDTHEDLVAKMLSQLPHDKQNNLRLHLFLLLQCLSMLVVFFCLAPPFCLARRLFLQTHYSLLYLCHLVLTPPPDRLIPSLT